MKSFLKIIDPKILANSPFLLIKIVVEDPIKNYLRV